MDITEIWGLLAPFTCGIHMWFSHVLFQKLTIVRLYVLASAGPFEYERHTPPGMAVLVLHVSPSNDPKSRDYLPQPSPRRRTSWSRLCGSLRRGFNRLSYPMRHIHNAPLPPQ